MKEEKILFEIPTGNEKEQRLENVLTAIYLLFNEGYSSSQHEDLIRKDLIEESYRLCELLRKNSETKTSEVLSLLALMSFTHARSNARLDAEGNILLLPAQDRKKWDQHLIEKGVEYIKEAGLFNTVNTYLLEAAIAYEHSIAASYEQTNWEHIINFYNLLYQLNPTPIIALNRAIGIAELHGAEVGIQSIKEIQPSDGLQQFYLYHATLGELYARLNDKEKAFQFLSEASNLTSSPAQRKLLATKMEALK